MERLGEWLMNILMFSLMLLFTSGALGATIIIWKLALR